ncbi:MAG: excinuclease ABC subunit C, partial [Clostridia bacterium]|nr:excinuclease ABC subunit C [Clostridia bacterium]
VTKMTNAKIKSLKTSSLEKIKGIGPAKAKNLLMHFGSLEALKNADADKLCEVKGITPANAKKIIDYLGRETERETK